MCTSITLASKEGNVFFGRTMDFAAGMFGEDPGSPMSIVTIPAGAQVASQLNPWTAKYAAMGVGSTGTVCLMDGVNDQGLAGDLQVLMECEHASASDLQQRNLTAVLGEEFVTFVLTHFSSVAEIKAHINEYGLLDQPLTQENESVETPLHFTFADTTNSAVVLEPTDNGAFKVYDSIGVMTNSPEYNWHLTNIRNYISLDKFDPKTTKKVSERVSLDPIEAGTGYGMFGLPGDYTSPSRFVRSTFLANNLDSFTADNGINQLYSVFRTAMVPRGLERASQDDPLSDCTRYWSGYDLTKKEMYVQTCRGLTFTAKKLNPQSQEVTYTDIEIDNLVKWVD